MPVYVTCTACGSMIKFTAAPTKKKSPKNPATSGRKHLKRKKQSHRRPLARPIRNR